MVMAASMVSFGLWFLGVTASQVNGHCQWAFTFFGTKQPSYFSVFSKPSLFSVRNEKVGSAANCANFR